MNKFIVFLLIAVSLFVLPGLVSTTEAFKNQFVFVNPTVTPTPSAEIEKIELDRKKVFIPCRPGMRPREENCGDNASIKVKVSVKNPRNVALLYEYTVSGGRIIGQGANVIWDLAGVQPGYYTITVGINDSSGVRTITKTESVSVAECDCPPVDAACPTLLISTPNDSVKAGETVTFMANVSGTSDSDLAYNWTVSQGEIIEGQGTPKIKVKTTHEMADSNLTVQVNVNSPNSIQPCNPSDSTTVLITK